MMNRPNQINEKLLSAAAALCVAAGLATAQQVKVIEKVVDGGDCEIECEIVSDAAGGDVVIEKVLLGDGTPMRGVHIVQASQPETKVESHIVMVQKTDDDEIKVEMKGDDIKAWVNGESVPSKRIKVTDKEIRILDKDGETITKFGRAAGMVFSGDAGGDRDVRRLMARVAPKAGADERGIIWEDGDGQVFEFEGKGDNEFFFQPDIAKVAPAAPPVMVGINMGSLDVDDDRLYDLLDEHDLDEADVIQIIGVIEGLPADKAGLREGDVIVRLDGKWGANGETLRNVLMKKKAGDNLEVAVVRKGRLREIDVKLSAYNAEKLGTPGITYFEADEENPFTMQWREENEVHNKMIEELTRKLAAQPKIDAEELRVQIEALAKNLQGQSRFPEGMELRLDTLPRMRGLSPRDGGDQRFFVEPGTRVQGGFVDRGQEERLEKIENRLERLESRIDRLIEALESRERDRD